MTLLLAAIPAKLVPAVWTFMGVAAVFGLLAAVSPKHFQSLAVRGGRWIDSSKVLSALDKTWFVDDRILPHARWLGVAVLAALALLAWKLMHV
jgi:hypothetical protein